MAFTAQTMFEVKVSNSVNDQTQNVPGKFGTGTGADFVPADCDAGFICVQNGLIPSEGYESIVDANSNPKILNGNTWYFNAAANGAQGIGAGLFACNTYDVQKLVNGENTYNIGVKTLGLGLPAGERGSFCQLKPNEQYTFGAGNFTAVPTTEQYATVANGKLTPTATLPTAVGGYFEISRTIPVNEGSTYWGEGYVLIYRVNYAAQ